MRRRRLSFSASVPPGAAPARPKRLHSRSALPLSALALVALAYATQHPGEIVITSPAAGTVVTDHVLEVRGTVGREGVDRIQLSVNGRTRIVPVSNGSFATRVPLLPGDNTLHATVPGAVANLFAGSDPVAILAEVPSLAIWTELTWDGEGDVDLHLYLPNGEHCYYSNKGTSAGARLDIDNTAGYGPEHITMQESLPGDYRLTVLYFAAKGEPTARALQWQVEVRTESGGSTVHRGVLRAVKEEQTVTTFTFPQ